MKQRTERQHFVPRFYLKNFSNSKEQVYVLYLDNKRIVQQKIDNVCVIKNLYETKWNNNSEQFGKYILDNKIENDFSTIEYSSSKIITKINNKMDSDAGEICLTSKERDILYEYIAIQYLRVPYVIEDTIKFYDGVESDPRMRPVSDLIRKLFEKIDINNFTPFIQHSKLMGTFKKEFEGSPLYVIYSKFSKMKIIFWKSNKAFITSSFPLLIDGDDECAYRIVLPLSCNNAIVLLAPNIYPFEEEKVINIPNHIVNDINIGYTQKYKEGVVKYLIANEKKVLEKLALYI